MWQASNNLISVDELEINLENPKFVIFDCRADLFAPDWGLQQYLAEHIPRAQFASLDDDLADSPGERGRHPLPERNAFIETVRKWGVNNDSRIITYDQGTSFFACRAWWMFRWLGHKRVSVLDGGFEAWKRAGLRVSVGKETREPSSFDAHAPLTRMVDAHQVANHNDVLLDAREFDRYLGQNETIDHRAGHIPNAISSPWNDNLNEYGSFARDPNKFHMATKQSDIICYCGSGVKATHNILALVVSGFPEPALYPGSWSEWIEDPDRPAVT